MIILALSLTINMGTVLAASSTSNATISQISSAASNVNSYYKTNKKLPTYVKVNNKNVTMPQFLYLLSAATSNINSGSKSSITIKTVNMPTSSVEKLTKGNIKKTEYVTLSKTLKKYIDTNGKVPNYLTTSQGKMKLESAVYMYSRMMAFYKTNNRLPSYVAVSSWTGKSYSLEEGSTSPVEVTVTQTQLNTAASNLKTFIETYNQMPTKVTVGGQDITTAQFLNLLAQSILNTSGTQSNALKTQIIYAANNPTESLTAGTILKSEYLNLALSLNSFSSINNTMPDSLTTTLGKMRYESAVYLFLKVFDFYSTNNRLPSYVAITPWTGTTVSGTGSNSVLMRPVYIISDIISNTATDNARINAVVIALQKLGIQAYNYGVGTDNIGILSNTTIPINALIVEFCGGACAGTIYEMGTSYYKNLRGSKKVFLTFTDGATKITGLSWLPRAHDDNFSPASFTGLVNPDQYLLNNGYEYYEGYTTSKLAELVKILYTEATT